MSSPPLVGPVTGGSGKAADTAETLLRLSGSTTIGDEAAPLLVRGWLDSKGASDESLRSQPLSEKDEKTGELATVGEVISGTLAGRPVQVTIRRRGSGSGFVDLSRKAADLAMSSREVNAKELADLAPALGNLKSHFSENVIGLDGVAVIVAPGNPVESLSLKQVHDMFTGDARTWDFDQSLLIKRYIRPPGSGTYDTFKDLVLHGDVVLDPVVVEDSREIDAKVAVDRTAIGFVSSSLVSQARAVAVSSQAGYRALLPSTRTIKTENYILRRRLYLYVPDVQPRNEAALSFIAYVKSDQGQQRVRQAKLIDLIPEPVVRESADKARNPGSDCRLSQSYNRIYHHSVDALCRLRSTYRQLQTSFFFEINSTELETLGADQVRRVVQQVETAGSKAVVLAGFADASGAYGSNCRLALARADAVAEHFYRYGIAINSTVSMCSEAPLVESSTPEGRRMNRRVEVYID